LATGYGLADAYKAVEAVKAFTNENCCADCASPERTNQNLSNIYLTSKPRKPMYSEFPKLHKKIDALLWEFEKELQAVINEYGLEDVELRISEANFIPRSPITKVAFSLRHILDECIKITEDNNNEGNNKLKIGDIDKSKITEEHVSAAQALLKIGRYQQTAINLLTQALLIPGNSKAVKDIKKQASEALSDCGTEIAMFDANSRNEALSLYDIACENGKCTVNGLPIDRSCNNNDDCRR
jgi:hypothetical protein